MSLPDIHSLVKALDLQPHPEGGYYRETYRSTGSIPAHVLEAGYGGDRCYGTAIYYLLEAGQFSAFHRIRQDEGWHFYLGGTLHVHAIDREGLLTTHRLGTGLERGETPQCLIRGGTWFGAEVAAPDGYVLAGCTVSPGFDFADFEMGSRDDLKDRFPQHAELVTRLTRG